MGPATDTTGISRHYKRAGIDSIDKPGRKHPRGIAIGHRATIPPLDPSAETYWCYFGKLCPDTTVLDETKSSLVFNGMHQPRKLNDLGNQVTGYRK